jgi:hypothetical protein
LLKCVLISGKTTPGGGLMEAKGNAGTPGEVRGER